MVREATIRRGTKETQIEVTLNLEGSGKHDIATGLGFLDHMLTHIAAHGLFDLTVRAEGDLHIDPHHTLEDVALTLGQAFDAALGERKGITRMGHAYVPMDEALAFVTIDFSGRPYAVWDVTWAGPSVGGIPVTLWEHFVHSFAVTAQATIHVRAPYGRDDHHRAEALFKALGRALDAATQIDPRRAGKIPSTKGTLNA